MSLLHKIAASMRSGRSTRQDPAARLASARWRQRTTLASVQHDLDELADEKAYIDAEIARSREVASRLESDASAAAADGCAAVVRELHEERSQTYAFLAELAEVRHVVAAEQSRLLALREELEGRIAAADAPARAQA